MGRSARAGVSGVSGTDGTGGKVLPPSSSRVWYTSSGLRKTSGTASRAGAGRRISGLASGAGALSAEGRGAAAWVKDQRGALRAGIGGLGLAAVGRRRQT